MTTVPEAYAGQTGQPDPPGRWDVQPEGIPPDRRLNLSVCCPGHASCPVRRYGHCMDEFLSLLAALVSAAAAVVGTMVSLAQYRQARSAESGNDREAVSVRGRTARSRQ